MPQQDFFVNCTDCGGIFKVICPQINKNVEAVKTVANPLMGMLAAYDETTHIKCPNCRIVQIIIWKYYKGAQNGY